ncbi:MAG: threonine synthase [Candidatus Portiera sp.]|nr:threonine synthase [Portiera sp.]
MSKPGLGILEKFSAHLDFIKKDTRIISLNEGDTPLIKLDNLSNKLKTNLEIYAKFEGLNPTGSFKDRGMTAAVTQAVQEGATSIICASTGNTSASAAAYAARAGIRAYVLIPEGKIAAGKLAQAIVYGAKLIQIRGNFDDAMSMVKQIADTMPITLVNSVNPYRLQGQKTAAFELVEELGGSPDYHCLPVGNAGNISAYWMGYTEYLALGKSEKTPIMCGYQASGAAPFLKGEPIKDPETLATAIRIGNPQSWDLAVKAIKESNGHFKAHSDEKIIQAQQLLASTEGIFCEPASAISIAGLIQDIQEGFIKSGSRVVCTLTGNGLKDTDTATKFIELEPLLINADIKELAQALSNI